MMEHWLSKELELNRKHEELIMRREALLKGTERYCNTQDKRAASFIADLSQAEERNQKLLRNINVLVGTSRAAVQEDSSPRFETLRKNYWSMVKSVFPVWYEQYTLETNGKQLGLTSSYPTNPPPPLQWSKQSPPTSKKSAPMTHTPRDRLSPTGSKRSPKITHTPRDQGYRAEEDEGTISEIPPLDLDFTADPPTISQNITPKVTFEASSTAQSSGKLGKKEKRVHYDEAQLSAAAKTGSGKSKSKTSKG